MLALRLGMTVRQLLAGITSAELTEWLAYFTLSAEQQKEPQKQVNTAEVLKAMFAHRVVKKKKGD